MGINMKTILESGAAAGYCKTLVFICQTTQCYILEDSNISKSIIICNVAINFISVQIENLH
jgi:hypothetical protein